MLELGTYDTVLLQSVFVASSVNVGQICNSKFNIPFYVSQPYTGGLCEGRFTLALDAGPRSTCASSNGHRGTKVN
ncbi:2392_t:CDS:2 [Acaulospora morrowiae]|uniref:2392_t:CDS:1 n=1 Tax=Acaulospora morrowiae TaxID=94023 RepID=A0A9N8YPT6_9GLOM|nr:2392_t:CDS:2 [Acaulospora morrowiae]